jgi:hypothetical protein
MKKKEGGKLYEKVGTGFSGVGFKSFHLFIILVSPTYAWRDDR